MKISFEMMTMLTLTLQSKTRLKKSSVAPGHTAFLQSSFEKVVQPQNCVLSARFLACCSMFLRHSDLSMQKLFNKMGNDNVLVTCFKKCKQLVNYFYARIACMIRVV